MRRRVWARTAGAGNARVGVISLLLLVLLATILAVAAPSPASAMTAVWSSQLVAPHGQDAGFGAIAVTPQGNLAVGGHSGGTPIVREYSPKGKPLWTARWNPGKDQWSLFSSLGCDAKGNVYAVANRYAIDSSQLVLVKFARDGEAAWVKTFTPVAGGYGFPRDMAVSAAGDAVITWQYSTEFGSASVLLKVGAKGQQKWALDQPDFSPEHVVLDAAGKAVQVGMIEDAAYRTRCQTRVVSPDGVTLWTQDYTPQWSDNAMGTYVVLDGSDVVVTGLASAQFDWGWGDRGFSVRYAQDGVQQWATSWAPEGAGYSSFGTPVVDSAGNVYLAVHSVSDPELAEMDATTVLCLNRAGNVQSATVVPMEGVRSPYVDVRGIGTTGSLLLSGYGSVGDVEKVVFAKIDGQATVGTWPASAGSDSYDPSPTAYAVSGDRLSVAGNRMSGETGITSGFVLSLVP
jgi:hypothetical protein